MSYNLRNRDAVSQQAKNEGGGLLKRPSSRNAFNNDEEPKAKRLALADLKNVNNVLSNNLLIDSSRKAMDLKKRYTRSVIGELSAAVATDIIFQEEEDLPELSETDIDPCPEFDFDSNEHDYYAVSEYAKDIFIYYKYRERKFKVGDYLKKGGNVTRDIRAKLVDWMAGVQEAFEHFHETFYLAVKIVDLYLDRKPSAVDKSELQLLAGTSFFVAAKFDERSAPLIEDVLYICEDNNSREQLLEMERSILEIIGFDLGAPLSYRFLRRYARVIQVDMATLTLARYILETSLMFYAFVHVSESLMASASLLLALRMKKFGDWSPKLQKYSGYTLEQVEPLMNCLNHMIIKRAQSFDRLKIIYEKYKHEVFYKVAEIPSLESLILIDEPIQVPVSLR